MSHDVKQIDPKYLENIKFTIFNEIIEKFHLNFLYDIQGFYHSYRERVERFLSFGRIGWNSYDFESQYLYELMSFKLKRVQYVLKTYGHHVGDEEHLSALKEAIDICDRLFNEEYEDKYIEAHNQKWGRPQWMRERVSEDLSGDASFRTKFYRKRVITEEDENKQSEELGLCFDNAAKDRAADIHRLAEILEKHQQAWWD